MSLPNDPVERTGARVCSLPPLASAVDSSRRRYRVVCRSPWTLAVPFLRRCSVARAEMVLLLFVTANCAIGFIPALLAAQGQRETKTRQIGVLTDNAPHSVFAEGFRG